MSGITRLQILRRRLGIPAAGILSENADGNFLDRDTDWTGDALVTFDMGVEGQPGALKGVVARLVFHSKPERLHRIDESASGAFP